MLIVCFFLHIKSSPNFLFGVLCLPWDQSHPFAQPTINPLARCICWAGLLGRAVFPPWKEGPNFGSYSSQQGDLVCKTHPLPRKLEVRKKRSRSRVVFRKRLPPSAACLVALDLSQSAPSTLLSIRGASKWAAPLAEMQSCWRRWRPPVFQGAWNMTPRLRLRGSSPNPQGESQAGDQGSWWFSSRPRQTGWDPRTGVSVWEAAHADEIPQPRGLQWEESSVISGCQCSVPFRPLTD